MNYWRGSLNGRIILGIKVIEDIQEIQEIQEVGKMGGEEPELWKVKMQSKRGLSIPAEIMEVWGLARDDRPTLFFTLDKNRRVLVIPAKDLKDYFADDEH